MAKLLNTIHLENGLKLRLYDRSRKLAGDRWLVVMTAIIDIPLEGAMVPGADTAEAGLDELKKAHGRKIRFEQNRQRHFINASQKDQSLQELVNSFLASSRRYLSHPAFAEKVVAKAHKEHLKKKLFSDSQAFRK